MESNIFFQKWAISSLLILMVIMVYIYVAHSQAEVTDHIRVLQPPIDSPSGFFCLGFYNAKGEFVNGQCFK